MRAILSLLLVLRIDESLIVIAQINVRDVRFWASKSLFQGVLVDCRPVPLDITTWFIYNIGSLPRRK